MFLQTRLTTHCAEGSGWACNEVGVRISTSNAEPGTPASIASASFERGCELGFKPACDNLLTIVDNSNGVRAAEPTLADYPFILRGSKREINERSPEALLDMACQQGWPGACGRVSSASP